MDTKPLIGLAGVVVGVSFSELNDQLVQITLPDITGGVGLSSDAATWLQTLYLLGLILGASTGPSLAAIFSSRRFLLAAIGITALGSLLTPVSGAPALLYLSRLVQGAGEGFIISNLIAVALKTLPPAIRLYGLVFYAMTATAIPSLAVSLAALWTDVVGDWRFVFLQAAPLATVAALLVWYGMPEEPPQYGRLKTYDWPGLLLAAVGFGSMGVVLEEGERFNWFASAQISIAALVAAVSIPLFLVRELVAETPLVGLKLLKKRNVLYAASALMLFIVVSISASQVPLVFLERAQGYRPLQAHPVTLEIALSQFVLLPAVAWLLDHTWADARAVSVVGLLCIIGACSGGLLLSSAWNREQFVPIQALQAIGQPLVVMPLLMMATNVLKPEDGVIGAPLVNAPRAVAEASGAALLTFMARWRGSLHHARIVDTLGQNRIALAQTGRLPMSAISAQPGGRGPASGPLAALNAAVQREVVTLTAIDTYIFLGALAAVLLVLVVVLPEKTYPPRIALAGQS